MLSRGNLVFCWGHSQSRAPRFYLKIKTRGFHIKPPTCLNFTGFKKREVRDCESAKAWERECDSEGEISLPRPRSLAISSLAFFKRSKFQTRLKFSCENLAFLFLNKKARLEIASGPNGIPYGSVLLVKILFSLNPTRLLSIIVHLLTWPLIF